ncbi:hypothetical protein [Rhizobium halophytocola]|uniref:Integral membrane protein n=1 Tax=Rhizobium halophytocola TaxID=735519 RepID=A0ABS4E3J9_9HYPH|nr:hypothetical protein [Rhizobium halophytocola]MBP1852524.1 putative integral membrane protein [Rhizobium halophytocola]
MSTGPSAFALISMILLGFLFLNELISASAPPDESLQFSELLVGRQLDSQIVTLGLEQDALGLRNKRGLAALYMRAYSQFLAIIGGTILSILGAIFVLARVDAVPTAASGEWNDVKWVFNSSSPGIVLALVGIGLIGMVVWMTSSQPIVVNDAALFVTRSNPSPEAQETVAESEFYKGRREERLKDLRGGYE